jgi:phosphohistidine phosphatase
MTRELLLLRHGKSDWKAKADDFHRPLKDRGKRGAQHIGLWLQQQDLIPDYVVSSPAERALVTAQKCCKAMGLRAKDIYTDKRIYMADPYALLAALSDCSPAAHRVLLVGHNPGLELLLAYLCDESPTVPRDGKLMPTATLACLSIPVQWAELNEGCARLREIVRASSLPKGFPYPPPYGEERRERPAYYYTQSSVIPYRITNGEMEVLITGSSKQKHWVVPKGVSDPGHSLQWSAAKEAWEEAGVEGQVSDQPLGSYQYEKWGASCNVSVYAMEVTRVISADQWEESHRGRRWVSTVEAARLLMQSELGPMVLELERRLTADRDA